MKEIVGFLFAVCLFVAFEGCAQNNNPKSESISSEYRKISAEEAKKMIDENPNVILIDVRTEAEYKAQHILGAILLPYNEIKDKAAEALPDKEAVILVYCRSGKRSYNAALQLIAMEYVNVYDFGGIIDWKYDTVSE